MSHIVGATSRPLGTLFGLSRAFAIAVFAFAALGACGGEDPEAAPVKDETAKEPSVAPPPPAATPPLRTPPSEPKPDAGVDATVPATCYEALTAKGVAFEKTTARGVVDAVYVKGAIGGVEFVRDDTDVISTDPMACSFVLTLERFAQVLKSKGVTKVGTLGSYCYRCCCSWSPSNDCRDVNDPEPSCGANGYSNHSWGRAVDVRYLTMQNGTVLDINKTTHWVEGTSATTCTSGLSAQTGVSKTLYGIVCATAAAQVFETILTPNYNGAHRNHWHMDTGDSGTFTGTKVRAWQPTAVDVSDSADRCGGH